MIFRPTLFFYVIAQFLLGIAIAFIVISGVIMLVDFVELSRSYGDREGVNIGTIAVLTFLKAPSLIEETLPFIVLFGVIQALYKLNRRSELIIMRAAGMSAWRFLAPGLLTAALIGVLWSTVINPLSVLASTQFDRTVASFSKDSLTQISTVENERNIWLREGSENSQLVIYAASADLEQRILNDATFYRFALAENTEPVFDSRFDVKRAELTQNGYWKLSSVVETRAGQLPQPFEAITLPTNLEWNSLREAAGKPVTPQFWNMPSEISKVRQAGFTATPLLIRFNRLLALPIMLVAMAVLAAVVSMRLVRLGGTLQLIIAGAAIGFGVFFANNMATAFGETGALPPVLAAWLVPLFVLFIGLARLCTIEDG